MSPKGRRGKARKTAARSGPQPELTATRRSVSPLAAILAISAAFLMACAAFLLLVQVAFPLRPFTAVFNVVLFIGLFCPIFVLSYMLLRRARTPEVPLLGAGDSEVDLVLRAFDIASAPRAVIGPRGRTVYANAPFVQLFRRHAGSGLGAVEAALGGGRERVRAFAQLCKTAATGIAGSREFELRGPAGEVEWRRIEAHPLAGYPGYIVLAIDDVTSEHNLVEGLQQEQKKVADFLESAPIGFYSVDETGRFNYMNSTLALWLGVSNVDIIKGGLRLKNFIASEHAESGAPYDPFGDSAGEGQGEVWLRAHDGIEFPVHVVQSAERFDDGSLRTRSIVRDLSHEYELRQTLVETEERIQRLFEQAPIGVVWLDPEGRIMRSNKAFNLMLGLSEAESLDRRFDGFLDAESSPEFAQAFARILESGTPEGPVEVHPADNRDAVITIYLATAPEPDGTISGVVAHCLDSTEQRMLEQQFAHSQKMQAVGQLAGGVAHDFNNLLTAMIGFCDLLLMRHKPGEQSFADIMQIKQNANRAADLVRQLLAFSRQQTLKPKVINITSVLSDLSHLLRRLVGAEVELKVVHGRDLGLVRVDQGQVEQVIINLIVNARDAMPDGGTIEVRTSNLATRSPTSHGPETIPAGNYVLIEVVDQGVGIPPENIERIFDPFFSTKEIGSGTGLGLSTVYGIVKQTGGYVVVDSEPGRGSRFRIFLPSHQPEETAAEAPAAAADDDDPNTGRDLTGAGRVMLVEDEDAVRLFSARALRNKGYTVVEARSGEEAMKAFQTAEAIDLLVTDIVMPNMDGTALIKEVKERWPRVKIICISGYAEDTFRQKVAGADDVHFLPKPFSLNQLAGMVKEVIGR